MVVVTVLLLLLMGHTSAAAEMNRTRTLPQRSVFLRHVFPSWSRNRATALPWLRTDT